MAILYIIGTPIGNLGDISLRAVETLKSADIVACEDTRRTLKLLSHLGIRVKMLSCRSHNEEIAAKKIIDSLDKGMTVAYACDAGTPALSDPGAVLVDFAVKAGHEVIPIPGPSAFAAILSVSGARDKTVIFEGFLSVKQGRRVSRLKELMEQQAAIVLYESPFRILKLLNNIVEIDKNRYVCIGREMTKIHEEFIRGTAENALLSLLGKKNEIKGEFSVYISGKYLK